MTDYEGPALPDFPQDLRNAAMLLQRAASEIERLRLLVPHDGGEAMPAALSYLRRHPGKMLYRGAGTQTWFLSGPDAPRLTFARHKIEAAVARGELTTSHPENPKIGLDCVQPAEP